MIIAFAQNIFSFLVDAYASATQGIASVMPNWLQQGYQAIFAGQNQVAIFLPVYPHPEMSGLVHSIGITTIVGFVGTIMVSSIFVGIFILAIWLLLKIVPWNTQ